MKMCKEGKGGEWVRQHNDNKTIMMITLTVLYYKIKVIIASYQVLGMTIVYL